MNEIITIADGLQFSSGCLLIETFAPQIDTTPITPTLSTVESLTRVVQADPTDRLAIDALRDALEESGVKHLTAVRRVNTLVRGLLTARQLAEVTARVEADTAKGGRTRTTIRRAVNRGTQPIPITVVAGDSAPVVTGEDGYSTFKGGGVCRNPGAAKRAGYKVEYHRSTLAITVGSAWVAANC